MTFIDDQLHAAVADTLEKALLHIRPSDLAKVIANIKPCVITGRVTSNEIILALGEYGDIWPEAIRNHAETAEVIHLRP